MGGLWSRDGRCTFIVKAGIKKSMNTVSNQAVIPNYNVIKIAIWLYFLLWIFEGALRKWILPSLATPLLIVRDPIAVYIIIKALNLNVKFLNPYVVLSAIFTLLGLVVTLTFGHGNLFVGLYGARIMMLHFPLIFIIHQVRFISYLLIAN